MEMVVNKAMVETIVKFTWTVNNFSDLMNNCHDGKLYSPSFFTGPHPWNIFLYPEEEEEEEGCECLSIYLAALDAANLPNGFIYSTTFKLSLINQVDHKMTQTITDENLYLTLEGSNFSMDTGPFMAMDEFLNANNGFLVNDTCIIVAEVSLSYIINASFGRELVNFKGVGKIEKDYFELLEKSCSKHPSLIQSLVKKNRSQGFMERGFNALGRVLHFLNTKKKKDMINDGDARIELQDLWDELVVFGFDDLTWLEPHVKSALTMKEYVEREEMVTKLKGDVVDLVDKIKSLKANAAAAKADLEGAKLQLAMAEKGFVERDLNDELGHGLP